MEGKLLFFVFLQLMQVSLAVWQRVTVMKGQTLHLSCPLTNANKAQVDWKNPEGYTMFFNKRRGEEGFSSLKDKRYSIDKLSESEFSVSISDVTFKDGGNYTCTEYADNIIENRVEVTVLDRPKMSVTRHDGNIAVKCTAEGNHFPPQISWQFDQRPEFLADVQVHQEHKKYVSRATLHVFPVEDRIAVKCFARHPPLHPRQLMAFVYIGKTKRQNRTTTPGPLTAQPQGSTGAPGTTAFGHGSSAVYSRTSSESSTVNSSDLNTVTAPTGIPLNTLITSGSTGVSNDTTSEANSTTDWTFVSNTTEDFINYNSTEGTNKTESIDPNKRIATKGNSALLVFLVTFLIFCLLIVVIFFAIKLRRAHLAWKRENEESNPSEESSKSKSSQEEKNSQGQRRRGLFNTAFTQYVVEEPTAITSVVNTAAMAATDSLKKEQTPQPQTAALTSAKCDMKETSL